jgi:hypothetical protein
MAVGNVGFATGSRTSTTSGFQKFLGRQFYFCMALLMAGLSVWGFRQTVDARLLHAKPPRPLLLWFHAAAFTAWIVLFVAQSALVRVRKVRVHRTLGWCWRSIFGSGPNTKGNPSWWQAATHAIFRVVKPRRWKFARCILRHTPA